MTSGLEWNEWALPYSNLKNDAIMSFLVEDPIIFVLNKPLIDEPGKSFNYAGGSNILLGEIIKNATKMNIDEFSGKYLFEPIGIAPYYWLRYKNGVVEAAGSIKITPRDMTKIGVTFLNKGDWNSKQIISEQWVDKSTASFPGNSWNNNWDDYWGLKGYSYSWREGVNSPILQTIEDDGVFCPGHHIVFRELNQDYNKIVYGNMLKTQ
jgi:CubicO group peptidase (beta-lactamase class C family)